MKNMYSIFLIFILGLTLFISPTLAQNGPSLWAEVKVDKTKDKSLVLRKSQPVKSVFYHLDINGLKSTLQNAPQRSDLNATSNIIIDFPTAEGKMESFTIMEASVMHPSLQAQHPDMRSYVGQSLNNPTNSIRFSVTTQGLHTMMFSSEKGTQFIDPYTKTGDYYIVYAKRDLPVLSESFKCEFIDEDIEERSNGNDFDLEAARNANDGQLRTYDLALACTIEYAAFHVNAAGMNSGTISQKKAAVLAAMNVTMTRVNAVYERELSLTMIIIPNNENIIFITSDNFANDDSSTLINQSQSVIDATIGSANYDIGHTFSTGAGGLAQLNSPCVTGSKARGVTGLTSPVGDSFDLGYVAHEMGHQFGSNHTFNGSTGQCNGANRSASNAYEPGSGSTIMAYAGICPPQNVQNFSDDYFHQRSLFTIWQNISTGNSSGCATLSSTGNTAPTAEAGANFTIPKSTPYRLTASSTDVNGVGSHTYTWEQYDLGPAGIPTETTVSGPLVRSFEGTSNPTRYIPRLPDLLNNYGSSTWEKLVSVTRPINFRVTVRDNDNRGGQTAVDNMVASVTADAGPFRVTSQSQEQIVWTPGTSETITWDVAGTTANGINTANVNILLSTDGGLTYNTVLLANTPNDGSQAITVPVVSEPYCRVMVAPVGNIYFSINTESFAIGNFTYELADVCEDYVFNANIAVPVNSTSYSGYALNVPDSFTITDFNVNVKFTHPNVGNLFYAVRAPFQASGELIRLASGACNGASNIDLTYDDEGSTVNCSSTNNGDVVVPQDALSIVDGRNSSGDWIFFITDVTNDGVNGIWNSTTLTLCQSGFVPTLGVDDFDIENAFTIFPNPNNGTFTIKLRSRSNQDIKVSVYDIQGRSIFNNAYDSQTEFNENINLNNVQSGVYLVKVSDGDRSSTKKIIIK